jgi:hypothetical protein
MRTAFRRKRSIKVDESDPVGCRSTELCTWGVHVCHYFIELAFAIDEFIANVTMLHEIRVSPQTLTLVDRKPRCVLI